jgi:hypothetical protein
MMIRADRWIPSLLASALLAGCNGPTLSPLAPTETPVLRASNEDGGVRTLDATSVNEWFQTQPAATAATADGLLSTIEWGGPRLEVLFNMCQASDADAGARLKFTYDFDGNGTIDYFGHCRQAHVYEVTETGRNCTRATVCISNRYEAPSCRQYDVCLNGPEPAPTATPAPTPTPRPTPRCGPTMVGFDNAHAARCFGAQ